MPRFTLFPNLLIQVAPCLVRQLAALSPPDDNAGLPITECTMIAVIDLPAVWFFVLRSFEAMYLAVRNQVHIVSVFEHLLPHLNHQSRSMDSRICSVIAKHLCPIAISLGRFIDAVVVGIISVQ